MESRKIALACVFGALITYLVTEFFGPAYFGAAIIAGAGSGYLGYEFREVLCAIPIAFQFAWGKTYAALVSLVVGVREGRRELAAWESERSAFVYPVAICTATLVYSWFLFAVYPALNFQLEMVALHRETIEPLLFLYFILGVGTLLVALLSCVLSLVIMVWPATIGAWAWERRYCELFPKCDKTTSELLSLMSASEIIRDLINKIHNDSELQPASLTYGNMFRWWWKGVVTLLLGAVFWVLLMILGSIAAIAFVLCELVNGGRKFFWKMFVLIHSHKRVLCAVDGTLGGVVALGMFYSPVASAFEHLLFACCGCLIGAALGVLNYQLISIRLLKIVPTT